MNSAEPDPPQPERPPLDRAALARAGRWRIEVVDESPSTNAELARRARAGEPPGLVLVTEHQTAGRGRLDRTWVTPPRAALTFSILVAPGQVPVARWPWLPLLAGLAVAEGVRRETGVDATLKWPNDVLLRGGKVAGILVELIDAGIVSHGSEPMAVVGIGLNVSSTRDELPVDTATSLVLAGATEVDRTALLQALLDAFGGLCDRWTSSGGRGLHEPYTRACSTIGREVRVVLPTGETLRGRAVDVDEDGRLLVHDGIRTRALGAGDVVHVRPDEATDPWSGA